MVGSYKSLWHLQSATKKSAKPDAVHAKYEGKVRSSYKAFPFRVFGNTLYQEDVETSITETR